MLLAVPLGVAIGLIVGTVGGGGSILALPVLVYLLGEDVGPASTASLVVIVLAAAVAAGALARHGNVCWRLGVTFSAPAALGSLVGALASSAASGAFLILAFVPVMLVASAVTWRRAGRALEDVDGGCPGRLSLRVVLVGVGVGAMTGFFGVGGGFVIVPALTQWLGVGFRRAVATSLVIITLTGMAALASRLLAGATIDVGITFALAGATMVGALAGTIVGARLPQVMLGRSFAVVVAVVAVFLVLDTLLLGGPTHSASASSSIARMAQGPKLTGGR